MGGFSYSEGLEAAIDSGAVHDEAGAALWLRNQLLLAQARGDQALIATAIGAWLTHDLVRVPTLNDWVLHTRESAELRRQAEQMGRSLADWLRQRAPDDATRQACTPMLAILSAQHEGLYSRLFRS